MNKINEQKKKNILKPTYVVFGIALFVLVWWLISVLVNSPLFPDPFQTIAKMFSLLGEGFTWTSIGGTFLRLIISFAAAFICGAILGVLAGFFYRVEMILKPVVVVMKTVPTAAVVLILIVLLKPIFTPLIVSFLVIFPLIYEAFATGVKTVPKDIEDALRMDGKKIRGLWNVYIPNAKPYIVLAVVQSFGLGMKVSIMSEILGGSDSIPGLGRMIHNAYVYVDGLSIFALSLIAILIIALIDVGVYFAKKNLKNVKK